MRIAIVASEVAPFSRTGGLSDVAGTLPKALAARGHDPVVFAPWHAMTARWFAGRGIEPEEIARTEIEWAGWKIPVRILRAEVEEIGAEMIFIAGPPFERPNVYATPGSHDDDLERYTFFCRGAIFACQVLGVPVDVLHVHDWQTAPLLAYLASGLRRVSEFRETASVLTIHNLHYQGRYPGSRFAFLGLDPALWPVFEYWDGDLNLLKGAILLADELTTVSPTYAQEILTYEGGAGLEGILKPREEHLTGILNGIDLDRWNPATDPSLPARFQVGRMNGKRTCRAALADHFSLDVRDDTPVVGIVSRLVEQKGYDLLLPVAGRLAATGFRFAVLGSGEPWVEEGFRNLARIHPQEIGVAIGFDEALSRLIIAGSDMILVPSRYEPCGLTQMYGLRYGTIPIVRRTGGLADTVVPWSGESGSVATGFAFDVLEPSELLDVSLRAGAVWRNRQEWYRIRKRAMLTRFSWEDAIDRYERVYERARYRPR